MSAAHNVESERYVAKTLRAGAYGSFAVLILATVIGIAGIDSYSLLVARIGVLILMATPALRIVTVIFMYLSERDKKMTFVAVCVLAIVIISSVVGLNLHS